MAKDNVVLTGWVKHFRVKCNLEEYEVVVRYEADVDYTSYEVIGVEDEKLKELIWSKVKEWVIGVGEDDRRRDI